MIKHMLPLLIGLSVCGVALAQVAPADGQAVTSATQTTTTVTSSWSTQQPAGALSQHTIEGAIATAGYKEVKGLEFKDGVWRSKARGGNKKWVKLSVGPVNGKVYPADAPSKLNADEISAKLAAAGYQNVKDVEFDEGLWSAEATTSEDTDVKLLVDPDNGSVVAKSHD